jgi:hypothetical protein
MQLRHGYNHIATYSAITLAALGYCANAVSQTPSPEYFPAVTNRAFVAISEDVFILTSPLTFRLNKTNEPIIVPAGFITDLASIPKMLHWWKGKLDRPIAAAIVHDYLYWYQQCTKKEADAIFYHGMRAKAADDFTTAAFYLAVSSFGEKPFVENSERRRNGEYRTVTAAYASKLPTMNAVKGDSLQKVLERARNDSGLVSAEVGSESTKATCLVALETCAICKENDQLKNQSPRR